MALSDLINAAETQYGIPKGLYARLLTKGENSGPYAVSPAGAIGSAQLMPGTARDMGVDPWDPAQNVQGGAKYFAMLLKRYNGDASKAVAAYNEGMGNVDRGRMPAETQAYLGRVLGMDMSGGTDALTQGLLRSMPSAADQAMLKQKAMEAFGRSQQASTDERKAGQEYGQQLDKELGGMSAQAALPPPPHAQDEPKAPHTEEQDPTRALKQFLPLLTVFAGSLNRGHGKAALAATVGALDAAKSNDQDAMKRAHDKWMDDMKVAHDKWQEQREEWDDIVKGRSTTDSETRARLEAYASKYGIAHMQSALANGDLSQVHTLGETLGKSLDQILPIWKTVQNEQDKVNNKWQVYTDPTSGKTVRVNAETGKATDLDGQPVEISGSLQKVTGTPRSAPAMYLQDYLKDHPHATPEEISEAMASYKAEGAATQAFGTGKQGQALNSFNVALAHLDTLGDLSKALENGDVKVINGLKNRVKTELGGAEVPNFNAAKQIVGDEIVKAITGGGGGVADREKAQQEVNAASSPKQLAGVIDTYKTLMAGQLHGLKQQYEQTTGKKDFDERLSPAARKYMGASGGAGGNIPAGAPTAIGKDNHKIYYANGAWRDEKTGEPVK